MMEELSFENAIDSGHIIFSCCVFVYNFEAIFVLNINQ